MARDFIKIATDQSAATQARELLEYKDALRRAYEVGVRVRAKMRHNFDDAVPEKINWADLEVLWGIPVGQGKTVFTLVDGSVGAMEGVYQTAAAKDITETLG